MNNVHDLYNEMKPWFEGFKNDISERLNNQYNVFTADEVCSKFGITSKTLRNWNNKGFPHSKINGTLYFTWEDIKHFLEMNKIN